MSTLALSSVLFAACESSAEKSKADSNEPKINKVSEGIDEKNNSLEIDAEISEQSDREIQEEVVDQTVNVEEKSTKNNNNQTVEKKNEKQENVKTEQTTSTEEENIENKDENEQNLSENIQISSGEEAVQFLKQQLPEGKNEDISFGAEDTLTTDENGSYYAVQLVDIPLRLSGKTGNLGYYKVYQDGTYKKF